MLPLHSNERYNDSTGYIDTQQIWYAHLFWVCAFIVKAIGYLLPS